MVFYLENGFPSSPSCPPDMANCTKLFHFPTTRRDIKLHFCNCSLLVCKEEIQSTVKSGSHTLPRLHMLFIYGSEIVAKQWCGKLAFKKIWGEKKKKDLFTGALLLPLRSWVDTFNKITVVYFYSLVLTSSKNCWLSRQHSGTGVKQVGGGVSPSHSLSWAWERPGMPGQPTP